MAWQDEQRQRRMMGEYNRSSRMLSSLVRPRLSQTVARNLAELTVDVRPCRLATLSAFQIEDNFDTPMTLSALRVVGTAQTRASFLAALLKPALAHAPETLGDVLHLTQASQRALAPWGLFKRIDVRIEQPQSLLAEKGAVDVVVDVKESGRLMLKSGTEVGQGEGSAVSPHLCRRTSSSDELEGLTDALLRLPICARRPVHHRQRQECLWRRRDALGVLFARHQDAVRDRGASPSCLLRPRRPSPLTLAPPSKPLPQVTLRTPLFASPLHSLALAGFSLDRDNTAFASHWEGLKGGRISYEVRRLPRAGLSSPWTLLRPAR